MNEEYQDHCPHSILQKCPECLAAEEAEKNKSIFQVGANLSIGDNLSAGDITFHGTVGEILRINSDGSITWNSPEGVIEVTDAESLCAGLTDALKGINSI